MLDRQLERRVENDPLLLVMFTMLVLVFFRHYFF